MSPKDKATTAVIIGNASTCQVIHKAKAVLFPPPSFLFVHLMKIKHCKVSISLLLYWLWLTRKGGRLSREFACSCNYERYQSGKARADFFHVTVVTWALSLPQDLFPLPWVQRDPWSHVLRWLLEYYSVLTVSLFKTWQNKTVPFAFFRGDAENFCIVRA